MLTMRVPGIVGGAELGVVEPTHGDDVPNRAEGLHIIDDRGA